MSEEENRRDDGAQKLTKAQRAFMADLVEDCGEEATVECHPHEWRTANSLAARGLCRILGERSFSGHFEAMATPAGRSAIGEP